MFSRGGPFYNAWIVALLPIIGKMAAIGTREPLLNFFETGILIPIIISVFFSYANFVLMGYFKDISADITDSFFKIQGSVLNNSQEICTFIQVKVEYTDVDGIMIAFGDSYLASQSLSPGQSSPFRIITQRPTNSPKPDSFNLSLSSLTGCIPPD